MFTSFFIQFQHKHRVSICFNSLLSTNIHHVFHLLDAYIFPFKPCYQLLLKSCFNLFSLPRSLEPSILRNLPLPSSSVLTFILSQWGTHNFWCKYSSFISQGDTVLHQWKTSLRAAYSPRSLNETDNNWRNVSLGIVGQSCHCATLIVFLS